VRDVQAVIGLPTPTNLTAIEVIALVDLARYGRRQPRRTPRT
jgi:hypothetical protein